MLDDRAFIFAQINYLAELVEDAEVDFALAFFAAFLAVLAAFLVFLAAFLVDLLVVLAAFLVFLAAFLVDFLVALAAFLVVFLATFLVFLAAFLVDFLVLFLADFFAAFLVVFLADFLAAFLLDDEAAEELLFEASDELEAFDDSGELVFFDEVAELTELVFFDGDSAAVLLLLTSVLFSVAARTGLTPVASRAAATVALPRFFIKRLFFIIRFLFLYRHQNNFHYLPLIILNYWKMLSKKMKKIRIKLLSSLKAKLSSLFSS